MIRITIEELDEIAKAEGHDWQLCIMYLGLVMFWRDFTRNYETRTKFIIKSRAGFPVH